MLGVDADVYLPVLLTLFLVDMSLGLLTALSSVRTRVHRARRSRSITEMTLQALHDGRNRNRALSLTGENGSLACDRSSAALRPVTTGGVVHAANVIGGTCLRVGLSAFGRGFCVSGVFCSGGRMGAWGRVRC